METDVLHFERQPVQCVLLNLCAVAPHDYKSEMSEKREECQERYRG